MRLRCHFGLNEPPRECAWWRPLEDFPYLVKFRGVKYEWAAYGPDGSGQVDQLMHFSPVQSYDQNWNATHYEEIDHMFFGYGRKCECGAIYTSFSWDHMKFCPLWTKW